MSYSRTAEGAALSSPTPSRIVYKESPVTTAAAATEPSHWWCPECEACNPTGPERDHCWHCGGSRRAKAAMEPPPHTHAVSPSDFGNPSYFTDDPSEIESEP